MMKKIFLSLVLLAFVSLLHAQMSLEFNTNLSTGTTITLPLDGTVNVHVEWGDGDAEAFTNEGDIDHTYTLEGIYTVTIVGTLTHFGHYDYPNVEKLVKVNDFGDIGLEDLTYAFCYAINLTHVPEQISNTVVNISWMFCEATLFNQDIDDWDVSNITDMSYTFYGASSFNQNIDSWDVSSVTDMSGMFRNATAFNEEIGSWDVSSVLKMWFMFDNASSFNQDIGGWDVSSVIDMSYMFDSATAFNTSIGNWNVSSVTKMTSMFWDAISFNQDIGSWDVGSVMYMSGMFRNANVFNQDIGNWDVSSVVSLSQMFIYATSFNQDLDNWDVSNVTNMYGVFNRASSFNQNIGSWDVGNVTTMNYMFSKATSFNQDIGSWDVSNVTTMDAMFSYDTIFNQDISNWDVSSVLYMEGMFYESKAFNQDIGSWDVSSVKDMRSLFFEATTFNQDIASWDVGSATEMDYMFSKATSFNQDIGSWDVSSVTDMRYMFSNITLSVENYDALLIGWAEQTLHSNIHFDGGNSNYSCYAITAHDTLMGVINSWGITDGGLIDIAPVADIVNLNDVIVECSAVSLTAPTSTDDCEETITATTTIVFPITESETVVWTYTDVEGNFSTQTQNVVVTDLTAPVEDLDSLLTVYEECFVSSLTSPTATDNCEGSITATTTSIFPITSSETVVWTFTDGVGNSSTQTQDVVITDEIDPIEDLDSLLTVYEECFVSSLSSPTATDNCVGTITATTTSIFPITSSETVVWTFTDGGGNTSTQTQDVVITDVIDPTITCPSNFTVIAENISQTYTVQGTEFDPLAFDDNCTVSFIINDVNSSSSLISNVFSLGITTVLWTVEDASGRQTTCSFDVTIETYTGINDINGSISLSIYPNPTNEQITIDCGSNFSMMNGYSLKITNTINQIVYSTPINTQQTTVDPSTWTENGIYFVHFIDSQNNTLDIKKIVIQ